MKRKDVSKAHVLKIALDDWSNLTLRLARKKNKYKQPIAFQLVSVAVEGNWGSREPDCQPEGSIAVDRETGIKIVAAARKIIADELRKLGVANK